MSSIPTPSSTNMAPTPRAGSCCPTARPSATCRGARRGSRARGGRSEEHTSELQSLMRISYAVFCLKKKNKLRSYHEKSEKNHDIDIELNRQTIRKTSRI